MASTRLIFVIMLNLGLTVQNVHHPGQPAASGPVAVDQPDHGYVRVPGVGDREAFHEAVRASTVRREPTCHLAPLVYKNIMGCVPAGSVVLSDIPRSLVVRRTERSPGVRSQ